MSDMNKIVRELFTESDNSTHDIFRYLALIAICVGLCMQGYAVIGPANQPFDMQTFGIGVGALLGGVGVALGLKKDTPPQPKDGDKIE